MSALIRSSVLDGYAELVTELGGDAPVLLKRFGIEADARGEIAPFVPYTSVLRLFDTTSSTLHCPDFGLRLSRYQGLDKLGPLALLAASCESVRQALATLGRYMHTYSPAVILALDETDPEHANVIYDVDLSIAGVPARRQKAEFSLSFVMSVLRLLIGDHFKAEAVLFRHRSDLPMARYRDYFGVVPLFGQQANAISIKRSYLDQPLNVADRRLHGIVDEYLGPLLDRHQLVVEKRVELLIARLLSTPHCRLSTIAGHLSMTERTLQRHLQQAGKVFGKMTDDARRQRTLELLSDPRFPMSQVSGLIGYSEQSTFTRACHRWFGASPKDVRQSMQSPDAAVAGVSASQVQVSTVSA